MMMMLLGRRSSLLSSSSCSSVYVPSRKKKKKNALILRCMLDFTSRNVNVIAAAAAAAGSHGAVTSAITQVAVTAVAIASGACLSTRVDCLWPKLVDQQPPPASLILDGVDVTGYPIFNDPQVLRAIAFAREAHRGQLRKTGDPYLTHCINTAKILAALVPSSGKKAIDTVVSGLLHDVVDDTSQTLHSIQSEFGQDIAKLVAGVSRLSYINQA
ncbi:putative GTP diphosphokinase RSH2, chloroplastic, partial [Bidens hawaiensis]|uniref:putative GTP diphosphokinase RSH2, chloroplastic n=1 Tax=Bidens hawaiensis TaxID=980011 RepID=UPI004049B9C5